MRVDGARVRAMRKASGRTLQELAADASLSVSFLSQVERGLSEPSFNALLRIAGSLNVPMQAISRDEAESRAAGHTVHNTGMYRDRFVTPESARTVQVLEAVLESGNQSRVHSYVHTEDEECIFVIEGEIEMTVDGEIHLLGPGQSLVIDPRKPHSYANPGTVPVRWLWISAKAKTKSDAQ